MNHKIFIALTLAILAGGGSLWLQLTTSPDDDCDTCSLRHKDLGKLRETLAKSDGG